VKPIGENTALPREQPIESLCQTNRERLHASREALLARALHDEMNMVRLHRILSHTHVAGSWQAQSATHHSEGALCAQARQAPDEPQGDVLGDVLCHALARDVRGATRCPRPSGAAAGAAPSPEVNRQLPCPRPVGSVAPNIGPPKSHGRSSSASPAHDLNMAHIEVLAQVLMTGF
jgi:hypothetical protein